MGKRAQAEGDPPPGTHPHWQGTTQRSPFFCRHQPGRKKKDLLSLREVATITIRAIETWAPQISTNKQTELSFLQNHCWGGGPHCGDCGCSTPGLGLGVGESSPSASVSSFKAALPTWMDTEGLPHGAINILFINASGFSRQTMHYFMVRKNQRKFK